MSIKRNATGISLAFAAAMFIGCSGEKQQPAENASTPPAQETAAPEPDPLSDKGIGPVTSIELGEVNQAMADKGKATFESKCVACHKIDAKLLGPALAGVTKRRSPEWIMNMILNPEEMTKNNEIAKKLLANHGNVQMTNQQLTQEQAREVLEYFRGL
ncbi:MAG: c-type cytochrome [Bacteroidia bacterium]|nr:c-type cytochrome [Bacteroidia bacterium]